MSKRSRERQLAKLAARRQAERSAASRRRSMLTGVGGGLLALVVLLVGVNAFFGGEEPTPSASPSLSPSASPSPRGGARHPDRDRDAHGGQRVGRGGVRRRGAGHGGEAEAAVRGTAADEDRSEGDLYRDGRDLVRHDRDRARSEARAADRQLLRLPRAGGVLRRAVLPSPRHLDRRDPGRRPGGHGSRRPGLRDPGRAQRERVVHARHPGDGQRGPWHRRQPVLPDHRPQRSEPRREPELHDLRARDRGPRRRRNGSRRFRSRIRKRRRRGICPVRGRCKRCTSIRSRSGRRAAAPSAVRRQVRRATRRCSRGSPA